MIAAAIVAGLLTGASTIAPAITPTADAAATPIYWGSFNDNAPFNAWAMDQFEADAGKKESIIHWGQPWELRGVMQSFQTQAYENVRLRGSIPMVNWNSWYLHAPIDDPNYTLAKIYGGTYDAYIIKWAQDAKTWGHPFFIRFNHEMNGWWYTWSEQRNGNKPGDYVKAWRHVVDLFRSVGATNATWVWSINIASDMTTPASEMYPGDNYVDWTAIDGYNKATDADSWLSFNQIFGLHPWSKHNTYQELVTLAPSKPIMVSETATTIAGGDAGAWIRDTLLTQLPQNFPQIKALVWFNSNDGSSTLNYRIESTPAQQAAFKASIGSSYYASNTFGSLPFGPIPANGGVQAPVTISATPVTPTATPATPTATPVTPTATPVTPTATPVTPTATPVTSAPSSTTVSIALKDVGDSYVDGSQPNSTAGGASHTLIADGGPYTVAFLRFNLASLVGKTITSAALRIHTTTDVGAGSNASFDIMYVVNNTWDGATMSMNNSVPISTTRLGTLVSPSQAGTWYQTSLTPGGVQVGAGGLLSIAVKNATNPDGVIFNSKEGDPALTPQLVLTYSATTNLTPALQTTTPITATPTPVTPTPTTVSIALKDIGDSYVDGSQPNSTAGGASHTLIADGGPYTVAFLRFNLASLVGKTITSAALRIHTTTDVGAGSNASFDIMYVVNNTWDGATMSMNNSVPISTTNLGTLVSPSQAGTWYQASLTPGGVQVGAGGLLSMAVKNATNPDGVIFNSKEGDPALTPQLVLTYR